MLDGNLLHLGEMVVRSMVICILLRSTAWYRWVKQHRPRLVLVWVFIIVIQTSGPSGTLSISPEGGRSTMAQRFWMHISNYSMSIFVDSPSDETY